MTDPAPASKLCPVCASADLSSFLSLRLPVNCSRLYEGREPAGSAPKGSIELAFCQSCGMIFNAAFEPALPEYDGNYENSLHFSPAFQAYCGALTRRIADSYGLSGKTLIEIGCGDGHFLAQLCAYGGNRGFGFDPAFKGEAPSPLVSVLPTLYSPSQTDIRADAVFCRHVLEHVPDPLGFFESIRAGLNDLPGSILYCETPNARAVLSGTSLWDVIYPHCSYFSDLSLRRALETAGFRVLQISASFEDQFLAAEAVRDETVTARRAAPAELAALAALVQSFARRFQDAAKRWSGLIESFTLNHRRVALWGAGAKAITFLNTTPGGGKIGAIVDANPRKQGMYVPGTGQQILAPGHLADFRPDAVILLNAAYRAEVGQALSELGIAAELWVNAEGAPSRIERSVAA